MGKHVLLIAFDASRAVLRAGVIHYYLPSFN